MKKIKFKKLVLNIMIVVIITSIITMFSYSIYEYSYKNTSDYYDQNSNIENLVQPVITFQEEKEIIENNKFNLKKFSNVIKKEIKYPITKYNIEANDRLNPTKIRIHYWTKSSNGYWYYSIKDM